MECSYTQAVCNRSLHQHWIPPDIGILKLNLDVSFISKDIAAGIGLVLRDCLGKDIAAGIGLVLRDCLGVCRAAKFMPSRATSAEEAEGLVVLQAVLWAKDMKIPHIIIEGDAHSIIRQLNGDQTTLGWSSQAHLSDVHTLLSSFASVSFRFTYREANTVADALASQAKASTTVAL
ncbi:hypothetical protein BVC80_8571g4 [Macleaya cordata]|uniref:RNase H type-1 domain-containing protein n=1 Tax=Macleaya cordata TaxID=56857 RepID=A0A200QM13_MACCD|nr:hypothetical protein BVC80_8571g4 [Macleaya cordata]